MSGTKEMSFWDHLDELRWSILRSLVVVVALSAVFLCIRKPLFDVVLAPASDDFVVYRLLGVDFVMKLINVDITAQFFVHLKVSVLAGLVIAFPYIVYELWRFISPELYKREKKAVGKAFSLSSFLFYLGVVTGYFVVLPVCLMFFMGYTVSDSVENTITLNSYMSMFMTMVFMIGLLFEFPSVVLVLSSLGILGRDDLKRWRRHAFIAILVLSAIITPSDPVSMFVLAIPLYALYEFSILVCKKRKPVDNE